MATTPVLGALEDVYEHSVPPTAEVPRHESLTKSTIAEVSRKLHETGEAIAIVEPNLSDAPLEEESVQDIQKIWPAESIESLRSHPPSQRHRADTREAES
jgi:hypothetical protein